MPLDWSSLGRKGPAELVKARALMHHAAQWPTKSARANLTALADDSHLSLEWSGASQTLFCSPLSGRNGVVRVGLRLTDPALVIESRNAVLDTYELEGRRESSIAVWLDSALRVLGLQPASAATLPYAIPSHAVARGSAYSSSGESEACNELARWFDAAADVLAAVQAYAIDLQAPPGPVRCWPHHLDIATLIAVDEGAAKTTKSIGIGLSPGDEYYAQPYFYISPRPQLDAAGLPALPPPGHWHTQGFVAAVATGEELLALGDRRSESLAFVNAAFEIGLIRLRA